MKRFPLILLSIILFLPTTTLAQTRKKSVKPKTTTSTTSASNAVRTAGANRVADQIKLLTRFIYLLGGVASGIAAVDEVARKNEASPEALQKNELNKATVKSSISGFREGLDKLEIHFRATPELQPYYIKLAGVAAGAANAEQQAQNNQFDAAGRSLLSVVNRLADVLVLMP